jgi:hypothetical protein
MARDRGVKIIFEDKPGGRRRVGRPRLRWIGGVENDLRTMGVKRWRNEAKDREMAANCEGGQGPALAVVLQMMMG